MEVLFGRAVEVGRNFLFSFHNYHVFAARFFRIAARESGLCQCLVHFGQLSREIDFAVAERLVEIVEDILDVVRSRIEGEGKGRVEKGGDTFVLVRLFLG